MKAQLSLHNRLIPSVCWSPVRSARISIVVSQSETEKMLLFRHLIKLRDFVAWWYIHHYDIYQTMFFYFYLSPNFSKFSSKSVFIKFQRDSAGGGASRHRAEWRYGAYRLVCLSVILPVTLWYCIKTKISTGFISCLQLLQPPHPATDGDRCHLSVCLSVCLSSLFAGHLP